MPKNRKAVDDQEPKMHDSEGWTKTVQPSLFDRNNCMTQ